MNSGSQVRLRFWHTGLLVLVLGFGLSASQAADWPMWRGDAGRTGISDESLPADLRLQWTLELPRLTPAWQEDVRLQFDAAYQPIVLGRQLFVASSGNDSVSAYDTETGRRNWRFFAGGPVRFAPVAHEQKIYFGSDDGCVYCLDATSGKQLWKFVAAPEPRKVIGNERLVSVWPVRGAPLLHENHLYFTAGVWPFEGVFLYALDAERGTLITSRNVVATANNPAGGLVTLHDRCPQGYLAISGDRLYVPCGRANPCCFDRHTLAPIALNYNGSKQADYHVVASGKWLVQGDTLFDTEARKTFPLNPFHPLASGCMAAAAMCCWAWTSRRRPKRPASRGGPPLKELR